MALDQKQEGPKKTGLLVGIGLVLFGFAAYYLYLGQSDSVDANNGEKDPPSTLTETAKMPRKRTKKPRRRSRKPSGSKIGTNSSRNVTLSGSGNESTSSGRTLTTESSGTSVTTSSSEYTYSTGSNSSASKASSLSSKQAKDIAKQILTVPLAPPIVPTNPDKQP